MTRTDERMGRRVVTKAGAWPARRPAWKRLLGLFVLLLVSGCGITGPEYCTLELSWRVTPTEVQLRVGESTSAVALAFTCGGRKSVDVDMRWSSDDQTIATVDETSGRITGIAPGTTTIRGRDVGPYGISPVAVPVTVTP